MVGRATQVTGKTRKPGEIYRKKMWNFKGEVLEGETANAASPEVPARPVKPRTTTRSRRWSKRSDS